MSTHINNNPNNKSINARSRGHSNGGTKLTHREQLESLSIAELEQYKTKLISRIDDLKVFNMDLGRESIKLAEEYRAVSEKAKKWRKSKTNQGKGLKESVFKWWGSGNGSGNGSGSFHSSESESSARSEQSHSFSEESSQQQQLNSNNKPHLIIENREPQPEGKRMLPSVPGSASGTFNFDDLYSIGKNKLSSWVWGKGNKEEKQKTKPKSEDENQIANNKVVAVAESNPQAENNRNLYPTEVYQETLTPEIELAIQQGLLVECEDRNRPGLIFYVPVENLHGQVNPGVESGPVENLHGEVNPVVEAGDPLQVNKEGLSQEEYEIWQQQQQQQEQQYQQQQQYYYLQQQYDQHQYPNQHQEYEIYPQPQPEGSKKIITRNNFDFNDLPSLGWNTVKGLFGIGKSEDVNNMNEYEQQLYYQQQQQQQEYYESIKPMPFNINEQYHQLLFVTKEELEQQEQQQEEQYHTPERYKMKLESKERYETEREGEVKRELEKEEKEEKKEVEGEVKRKEGEREKEGKVEEKVEVEREGEKEKERKVEGEEKQDKEGEEKEKEKVEEDKKEDNKQHNDQRKTLSKEINEEEQDQQPIEKEVVKATEVNEEN